MLASVPRPACHGSPAPCGLRRPRSARMAGQGGEYSLATMSSARLPGSPARIPGVVGCRVRRRERPPESPVAQRHAPCRFHGTGRWCGGVRGLPEVAQMDVANAAWMGTLVGLTALLIFDLMIVGRRPHDPSMRESTLWVLFYLGLAGAFGAMLWAVSGARYAGEFFAGWITEYSLSVDNLFVFVIIMARFAVPRAAQQKVLLIGIVLALVMRGAFIAVGAAAIARFDWVFYLFGIFLVYTAVKLSRSNDTGPGQFRENPLIRWSRRVLPLSKGYDGARMT